MPNGFIEEKRRFNIVDALIIVLAILCILAVALRSQINTLIGLVEKTSKYRLTFKVSSISASSYTYFERDELYWDKVYLDSPDLELGVIEGTPEVKATAVCLEDAEGNLIEAKYPTGTYVDIIGTISCNGIIKEDGCFYLSGNYVIAPGDVLRVHTVELNFSLTVIDIGEIEV